MSSGNAISHVPSQLGDHQTRSEQFTSSVEIQGDINPSKPYAVYSTTTDSEQSVDFVFYLPLTALAWKRIGFESLIIIVGSAERWNSSEVFRMVLSKVRELDCVVVFVRARPENEVMMSQVSRQVR